MSLLDITESCIWRVQKSISWEVSFITGVLESLTPMVRLYFPGAVKYSGVLISYTFWFKANPWLLSTSKKKCSCYFIPQLCVDTWHPHLCQVRDKGIIFTSVWSSSTNYLRNGLITCYRLAHGWCCLLSRFPISKCHISVPYKHVKLKRKVRKMWVTPGLLHKINFRNNILKIFF